MRHSARAELIVEEMAPDKTRFCGLGEASASEATGDPKTVGNADTVGEGDFVL